MELAYLAGLVDGEGSVGWFSKGKGYKCFCIEIKMTTQSLIMDLQKQFGGYIQYRPSTNPDWKDQWRWRVQGSSALILYEQIKPFLRVK